MIERKHPLAKCENCPLVRAKCAPTQGLSDAKIAFVSRSPGYYDVGAGKPFAGPSGRVLDHLLGLYNTSRDDIITTNVVLCEYDGTPPQEAVNACHDRLVDDLKNVETIIAGGVEAVHELIHSGSSISSARGRVHVKNGKRYIASSNPAVVLRESNNFPDLVKDFRLALRPIPTPNLPKVEYIETVSGALEFFQSLDILQGCTVASDLETAGFYGKIACAGFSTDPKKATVISWEALDHPDVYKALKQTYENKDITWLWHNGKYDVKVLRKLGINARIDEDTFLLSLALDERPGGNYQGDQGAGLHALTSILMEDYGWPDYKPWSVTQFKKDGILREPYELYEYNGHDTAGTLTIFDDLDTAAHKDNVRDEPYERVFIPLANALISTELRGFNYDVEAAADMHEEVVVPKLNELRDEMRVISGRELLNPRSNKQIKGILYEQYGLVHSLKDTRKHVKTGSVDTDVRKEILEDRFKAKPGKKDELKAFVEKYEIFQKVDKQRGNYFEGLIKRVQEDGKLYSTFKFGTETGRTSSENPNFQNITRSGAHGIPSIRTLFKPSPGCQLISADYSQAELRTIAKLSQSKKLLEIYRDTSRSLHKERAAHFYGKDYDYEQYVKAKNINFGVSYGQSAFTFAQMYTMPEQEAQAYIDDWFTEFPEILEWHKDTWMRVKTEGEVVSPFGHKRRFHLITKENKDEAFRQAINFLPQNIAGVLTELALVELVAVHDIPVVTTVHDSIVADVPTDDISVVSLTMKNVMEQMPIKWLDWTPDDIPFKVDISVGDTWADVKEVELEILAA